MKATFIILFAAIASVSAARELQQATTGRVTFFDNTNFSGGGQAFEANVPATGCGDCKDLVRTDFAVVALSRVSVSTMCELCQTAIASQVSRSYPVLWTLTL